MDAELATLLNNLKTAIENDERVLALKQIDDKLNKDEEVMKLAYQKDMASLSYEDALKHFPKDSKEVKDAQIRLHQAKLALDNHPLVKQYNEAYKNVRLMYEKINEELFSSFKNGVKHD